MRNISVHVPHIGSTPVFQAPPKAPKPPSLNLAGPRPNSRSSKPAGSRVCRLKQYGEEETTRTYL